MRKLQDVPNDPINFHGAGCVDYDPMDMSWSQVGSCDDCFTDVNLGFTFDAFGIDTDTMRISTNGFLGKDIVHSIRIGDSDHVISPLYGDIDIGVHGFRGE